MCKWNKKPTEIQKRGWQGHLLFLIGMMLSRMLLRLRYIGQSNIPTGEKPYLVVANHQTMFDGLWIMGGIPQTQLKRFSCLAGSDLEKNFGLTGRVMFRVGKAIPIDREGNPIRGLILARRALQKGSIVMIHPEGTRTYDGKIGEIKNGAAYLAKKTGVPVIPVYIDGGYEAFSRYMPVPRPIDWKHLRRKKLTVEYGLPIYPSDYDSVDTVMEAISRVLLEKEEEAFKNKANACENPRRP
ncbi:MAG TPA: lysophospholipid acyltransferase family protein [Bacillota bacterium]|nr:lysophospholipid acyltransferase family protein [Bacillota bacterium]